MNSNWDPAKIEEELELIAEAMRLGIDPFPPRPVENNRCDRRWTVLHDYHNGIMGVCFFSGSLEFKLGVGSPARIRTRGHGIQSASMMQTTTLRDWHLSVERFRISTNP